MTLTLPYPKMMPGKLNPADFSLDGPHNTNIVKDEEINFTDLQNELIHWHYQLGHLSFSKLWQLPEKGNIRYQLRNA